MKLFKITLRYKIKIFTENGYCRRHYVIRVIWNRYLICLTNIFENFPNSLLIKVNLWQLDQSPLR